MKIDRDKFLAAVVMLQAASATAGCSRSSNDTVSADRGEGTMATSTAALVPNKVVPQLRTLPSPAGERALPAPAGEAGLPAPASEAAIPAPAREVAVPVPGAPPVAPPVAPNLRHPVIKLPVVKK